MRQIPPPLKKKIATTLQTKTLNKNLLCELIKELACHINPNWDKISHPERHEAVTQAFDIVESTVEVSNQKQFYYWKTLVRKRLIFGVSWIIAQDLPLRFLEEAAKTAIAEGVPCQAIAAKLYNQRRKERKVEKAFQLVSETNPKNQDPVFLEESTMSKSELSKSEFIKATICQNYRITSTQTNQLWQNNGNPGVISQSLFYKVKSKLKNVGDDPDQFAPSRKFSQVRVQTEVNINALVPALQTVITNLQNALNALARITAELQSPK